jgi:alpha-L-rhamnosidase
LKDTFSHRTYFMKYDVASYLQEGENTLQIVLGNGWFRQRERNVEGDMRFGDTLRAIYALTVQDASGESVVLSDGSEVCCESEIRECELFIGEVHDFVTPLPRMQEPVQLIEMKTQLTEQTCPPDRKIRTITPVLLREDGDVRLYDCGEVVSGFAVLDAAGQASTLTVTYSEELTADGKSIDPGTTGSPHFGRTRFQVQCDVFHTDGQSRTLAPRFSWHAFRYFTVKCEGAAFDDCVNALHVDVVHSDTPITSSFESDSEALNWLYEAYLRTQLDNMHGSIPSDCPHRERLGYTGDGQVACDAAMLMLDSKTFYEKWITDIIDGQDKTSGHVQHTAPFMGGGGGPCGWGGAIIEVPYQYYRHYGGKDKLLLWYPAMRKYVSYILSRSDDGLVVREEEGGWCLGDWASMDKMRLPEAYVNSCLFMRQLRELAEVAGLLGLPADAEQYRTLFENTRRAVIDTYYDAETGNFFDGTQAANAFALDVDIAPDERALQNMAAYYESLGYLDTGFIGTDILFDVLLRNGKVDLAYALMSGEKMGSYLWMKRQGATTLYEYLNGFGSHCHPMFGAPAKYLFRHFLGICKHFITERPCVEETLRIAPMIPRAAKSMSGSISTRQGDISVAWHRDGDLIEISVGVPEGLRATFAYGNMETELHPGESTFTFCEALRG